MSKFIIYAIGYTNFGLDSFTSVEQADCEDEAKKPVQKEIDERIQTGMWEYGDIDRIVKV